MPKVITLLFFFSLSIPSYALDINYHYGVREVSFNSSSKVWSLRAPGKRLTIEEKKCNKALLSDFKDRLIKKLGQTPHQVFKKKSGKQAYEIIRYQMSTNKVEYGTAPKSKTGQILLRLPQEFVALKLQAIKSCKP